MRFACLIYFDPKEIFNSSAASDAVLAESGPFAASLAAKGQLVLGQPLSLPSEAVTISMRGGRMSSTDGPFIETKELLGGFLLIDAADRDEAVHIASQIPFARLGHIEVRPAVDTSQPRPYFPADSLS
jgi:hypothetical protein